jgi:hypothetical protein
MKYLRISCAIGQASGPGHIFQDTSDIFFMLETHFLGGCGVHRINWLHSYIPHRKKSFSIFPSPAGMSLTKLFLGGNNLYDVIIPGQGEFGK